MDLIAFLSAEEVIRRMFLVCASQCAENTKFLVRASYLEIYNEEIRDLLGSDTKHRLEASLSY